MSQYIPRRLERPLSEALDQFPVVLVTGARQAGKSTLLRHSLHGYNYVTLDDVLVRELAKTDPALFLKTHRAPLIIDEIQYAPGLLEQIKLDVDENRKEYGRYVLTGSQFFPLMHGVGESLSGRIMVFQLYPLSVEELPNFNRFEEAEVIAQMLRGFYPEFSVQPNLNPKFWHSSYLTTYIERDIRSLRNIHNLSQFHRYLVLLAARAGQLLNLSEISKECGISQTTARDWLVLLESTSIIYLLEPYASNLTKRVVKAPKIYFVDTGLLCYLLRIHDSEQLTYSPFSGHVFENMVVMEAVKHFAAKGERAPCYFYRSDKKVEVDLIIDFGTHLDAYEIKFSASPKQEMTKSLALFRDRSKLKHAYLLNLRESDLPFSNGITAKHWSHILSF